MGIDTRILYENQHKTLDRNSYQNGHEDAIRESVRDSKQEFCTRISGRIYLDGNPYANAKIRVRICTGVCTGMLYERQE
jgi:hypothetical protein